MDEFTFGKKLHKFRSRCRHPQTGAHITQIQFAEYLYEEMGVHYTGAAISDWERDKSIINVNHRNLLTSIIKVLKKYNGIQLPKQANELLESGNYRALNAKEQKILFPEIEENKVSFLTKKDSLIESFIKNMFFHSSEEFQIEWKHIQEGPSPTWPRLFVGILNKQTEKLTLIYFFRFLIWVWISFGTYWLITPSFQFPFSTKQELTQALHLYVIGSFILPFFNALMVNLEENHFWKTQSLEKSFNLRLYILQGAYLGFYVAYFLVFFITFTTEHFRIPLGVWFMFFSVLLITASSYASAHLVPYNLWRAYKRLYLKDGWIFFIFIIVGPLWAWFVIEFHEILFLPILGFIFLLIPITIIIVIKIRKKYKSA